MNLTEFSDNFTVLLNSHWLKGDFGESVSVNDIVLNEHEKSVFLTNAQDELVIDYYSGKRIAEAFEETEETRRALAELTVPI